MNWIPFIFFVALPLTIALFTGYIFAHIPFIKHLRTKAVLYDRETFSISSTPIALRDLRDHQHLGDKTVIVHHLSSLTRDVERKLRNSFLEASALSALTVLMIAAVTIPMQISQSASQRQTSSSQTSTSSSSPETARPQTSTASTPTSADEIGFLRGLVLVLKRVPIFFLVPIGEFVAVIRAVLIVFFLQDQASKFSDLLEDATV